MPIEGRTLSRDEIAQVWTIDRREVIDAVYRVEDGGLVLKPEHHEMAGWPPGEPEQFQPHLESCHDHGGWFHALFDGDRLIAVTVLENRFIGRDRDQLQLKFLHVSHDYRHQGLGRGLFHLTAEEARRRGARRLYISATPSERTVGFYLALGCRVALDRDPELLALEPDDIHLEFELSTRGGCSDPPDAQVPRTP